MITNQQVKDLTPKSFWFSKTIWLGLLTTLISVLGSVAGQDFIQQYPQVVSAIGAVIGILTVVMRYITTRPVTPPTTVGDGEVPPNLPQPTNPPRGSGGNY